MNPGYGPALRRFWWVVAVGAVVAGLIATLMVFTVSGFPPSFTKREQPVYTATARLFVTSGEAPHLRTSVPRSTQVPLGSSEDGGTASRPVQTFNDAPDVKTLVDAANVYPLLIESDDVANLRTAMFGELPGEVTAKAIFATATPNRYLPSTIPVIELFASADTPGDAIELAATTSTAFRSWMAREQSKAGIDQKQRILIRELQAPTEATAVGGGSLGLPVLAVLAILTAFGAGAIMLDRMYPRKPVDSDAVDADATDAVREDHARDRHVGISETG